MRTLCGALVFIVVVVAQEGQGSAPTTPGYYTNGQTSLVTSLPDDLAIVAVETVNVYSAPSSASSNVGQVAFETGLKITGRDRDWFEVVLSDGRTGWVAAGGMITAPRDP